MAGLLLINAKDCNKALTKNTRHTSHTQNELSIITLSKHDLTYLIYFTKKENQSINKMKNTSLSLSS